MAQVASTLLKFKAVGRTSQLLVTPLLVAPITWLFLAKMATDFRISGSCAITSVQSLVIKPAFALMAVPICGSLTMALLRPMMQSILLEFHTTRQLVPGWSFVITIQAAWITR